MKTKFKQLLISLAVLGVLVVLPAAVRADPITFTLDDNQVVNAGASTTFFGTLSNGGAPARFINSLSFTFASGAPGTFTFDVSPFFANIPAVLNPGTSVGPVAFFNVAVSALVPPGTYSGSASVRGGATANDNNTLGTQDFTITVRDGGQPAIPEPTTMLLLGSGLVGAAVARRRKRRQSGTH